MRRARAVEDVGATEGRRGFTVCIHAIYTVWQWKCLNQVHTESYLIIIHAYMET